MSGSQQQIVRSSPRRRPSGFAVGIAAVSLALAASLAAMALAAGGAVTVTSASSSKLGEQIVIDARGRTLYAPAITRAGKRTARTSTASAAPGTP